MTSRDYQSSTISLIFLLLFTAIAWVDFDEAAPRKELISFRLWEQMSQCHHEVATRPDGVDDVDFLFEVHAGLLNHPLLARFSTYAAIPAAVTPKSVDAELFNVPYFRRCEELRLP